MYVIFIHLLQKFHEMNMYRKFCIKCVGKAVSIRLHVSYTKLLTDSSYIWRWGAVV